MDPDLWASRDVTGFFGHTVFRYANYDTPFWARNNRSSGRWHVAGDGATQYVSLHPDGAWADLARREDLRTDEELELVRMQMWVISLTQSNLVDYSTFEKAEAAGFAPEALVDDDHTRCQVEGERLREAGFAGVVAPSAALPGTTSIVIFGRRVRSTWGVATKLASAVPCCVVAVGCSPPGLAARVRYVGEEHAAYEAYADRFAEDVRLNQVGESEALGEVGPGYDDETADEHEEEDT